VNHRRKKRSQEHAAASREAGGGRAPLEHPMVLQGAADVITTQEQLGDLVADICSHGVVAYDTEFIGEESFYPKLCLVQVATPERIALVDPLPFGVSGSDLSGLAPLFRAIAAPGRTVLVHSGDTDVDILRRGAGLEPESILDTQVAAALAWMPWPSSLGAVVESSTGYRLGKAHTFTNWDARPLTQAQLGYAADDVRYLHLAWHVLSERLGALGRLAWAATESREQLRGADFEPDGQMRRINRSEPLRPSQAAVARALVMLRYELARAHDLPARVVMPDSAVIEFAKRKPVDRAGVMNVSGMPRRLLNEHADDVAAAIEAAKAATPESERPHPLADDPRVRAESDQLWNALQARCASVGLASNLVTTRGSFSRWYLSVAEARRAGRRASVVGGDTPLFQGGDWRHEAIGRWLDGFVSGTERLELEWSDAGMVAPGMRRPPGIASPS
jgi:ribonuclease D